MIHPDQIELLNKARLMIEAMRRSPPGSPAALLLQNFLPGGQDFDLADLVIDLVRQASRPVTLDFPAFGFVRLGHVGHEITLPDPHLDGLHIAFDVFTLGVSAPAVLRATDWGKSPRGAANAVHRAAEWVERYCPALATAMNQISFDNDGRPCCKSKHIEVNVFPAYSCETPP